MTVWLQCFLTTDVEDHCYDAGRNDALKPMGITKWRRRVGRQFEALSPIRRDRQLSEALTSHFCFIVSARVAR